MASISYMFSSQLGINIIAESLHQTINTRLNILRDMMILLKLCLKHFCAIFPPRDDNPIVMERIRSYLLPRVTALVKGYHVMHWMGQVPCGPVTPTMLEASMQQLAVLSMVDRCTLGTREMARYAQQQSQRTVTLLSLFLSSRYSQYAHNLLAQMRLDEDDISQWHTTMLPYLTIIGKLLAFELFVCIPRISSLLLSVPPDSGVLTGVHSEEFLNSRLGQYNPDGPEPTDEQREMLYYLKIMKMFEQVDQSDCVIRVVDSALITPEVTDPDTATLHSAKFCHLLRLGRHKTAYIALVNNPDKMRRRDSLRQLINSMVEAGKIEMLVNLDMNNEMRTDMESILLDKARSHDLLHSQYYSILHALHINRLDMRGGARIMYEQAFRLSQEVTGPVSLERQARSLLACINELSLASERFRWLLKPRINLISGSIVPMDPPNASPKRDYDGDEVKRGPKNIPVEIVELEDIRKEYQVVLAKIQLLGQNSSKKICSEVSRLSVHQLLGALCNAGRFDLALRLASLHSLPKSPILEAVVASCVCITRNEGLPPNSINWLAINDTKDLCKVDVQTSKVAWKYLQRCLELHEEKCSTELHRAIRHNIAELLRLLLAAGRLEEAARLGCDLYRAGMGLGHEDFDMTGLRQVPACVWMPHNILDWAIAELEAAVQAGEDIVYHELLLQMQDLRDKYLAMAHEVSQELRIKTTRNVNISQQTIQL
ncbi:hypothetical protein B566_EDAN013898 [Ephemera danica]|nr:hypothetical protein B566_EDAN013898 [Ephemera danica]